MLFTGNCCLLYVSFIEVFFVEMFYVWKKKKISDFGESLVLIPTFSHLLQTWSYLYFTGNKTPRPQRKRTDRRNAGRVFQDKDIYRNCKLLDYLCIKIFWTQKFPTIDIERIEERSNRKSECQIENEAKYIHVFRFILCCWCFGVFFKLNVIQIELNFARSIETFSKKI